MKYFRAWAIEVLAIGFIVVAVLPQNTLEPGAVLLIAVVAQVLLTLWLERRGGQNE